MNSLYLGVLAEVFNHLESVEYMALNTQGECFQTLKEYESVERGDCRTGVAQENCTNVGNESSCAHSVGEADSMVGGVRLGDPRISPGLLPVEVAAVNDHTTDCCSVSTDELGC